MDGATCVAKGEAFTKRGAVSLWNTAKLYNLFLPKYILLNQPLVNPVLDFLRKIIIFYNVKPSLARSFIFGFWRDFTQ